MGLKCESRIIFLFLKDIPSDNLVVLEIVQLSDYLWDNYVYQDR